MIEISSLQNRRRQEQVVKAPSGLNPMLLVVIGWRRQPISNSWLRRCGVGYRMPETWLLSSHRGRGPRWAKSSATEVKTTAWGRTVGRTADRGQHGGQLFDASSLLSTRGAAISSWPEASRLPRAAALGRRCPALWSWDKDVAQSCGPGTRLAAICGGSTAVGAMVLTLACMALNHSGSLRLTLGLST